MKNKIKTASLWSAGAFASTRALQLVSNLVFTRVLYPEAFGLMVIVNIFIIGLSLLSDVGLRTSVIQNQRGSDDSFLMTVWTIRVFRGVGIFVIACLCAWPISKLYDQPVLFYLICVCSSRVVFDGLNSIKLLLAERELDLKLFAILQICTQITAFISTLIVALLLESVWALAAGSLTSSIFQLVLSHKLFPHPHRLHIERTAASSIFHFGKWIFISTALTFLGGKGLDGIKGLMVTTEMLSLLFISGVLCATFIDAYRVLTTQIIFPYLSEVNRTKQTRYKSLFTNVRYLTLPPVILTLIIVSVFSQEIVNTLYDARYTEVGSLLAFMALNAGFGASTILYVEGVVAKGNTKAYFLQMIMIVPLRIVSSSLSLYYWGPYEMLIVEGSVTFLAFLISYYQARKYNLTMPLLDIVVMGVLVGAYAIMLRPF